MKNKPGEKSDIKRQVTSLFRRFAAQLQAMDDAEFERLIKGERFEIRLREKQHKVRSHSLTPSNHELDQLRGKLNNAESREEARALLEENLHDRAGLYALAQLIDVPIPKRASSDNIKDRIVEATVGYVFRSAAIRGSQKKGSP